MLDRPLRWKKPRLVFVNSMSDLFHDDISDEFILRVFDVMRSCLTAEANVWPESHAFQVLTKRPERMRDLMKRMRFDGRGTGTMSLHEPGTRDSGYGIMGGRPGCPPLPNVWLGVTAENQEMADERIPLLLDTPAAVRFVSAEPLLGPIDFEAMESKLDWIIVGGESGLGARPCAVEWIRSIVEQCGESEVACFVKQLGARPIFFPGDPITGYEGIAQPIEQRHSKGGDPVEWPEDLRVQEYPTTGEPGR